MSVANNGAEGNGASLYSDLSADGRFVAFVSNSDNLVSKDINYSDDIFIRDRLLDKKHHSDLKNQRSTTTLGFSQ